MTDLIKNWITKRTGIVMDMNPEIFAEDVMDGTIIAKILCSYNIISHHQFVKVLPTDNINVAYKNLKLISCWLKTVGISYNNDDLLNIANKNCLSATKLFYELYLNLQDKDKLHFTARLRANQKLHPNDLRFEVRSAEAVDLSNLNFTAHPLSVPLIINRDVIDWNKNRYQKLQTTYKEMRRLYATYIEKKFQAPIICEDMKSVTTLKKETVDDLNVEYVESTEDTYEELIDQQRAALNLEKFKEDPKVTRRIVKGLKQKRRHEIQQHEMKVHQQKMSLLELWNNLLIKQEKEFDNTISNKLLKQSVFEKQIVTKMFEIRQQKHNMLYNRRFVDEQTMLKKEKEFLEQVFLRQKGTGDQKFNYYFEKERALELHQRLYRERLRLESERNYKMCSDVMKDIVNIAIRHVEYMEEYDEKEVPKRVQTEWTNLFTKQQPIFDILTDVSEIVQDNNNSPEDYEEILCVEIHRQNKLDQRDFEKYINYEWPWELEDLLNNYEDNLLPIQLGMNVLGHNVHRVLATKYPKLMLAPKPNLPKFRMAVCINGLTDLAILPVLQKLLNFKKVKVVEIQEAINYSLEIFKKEIRTEYIDNTLIEESTTAILKEKLITKDLKKGKHKKGRDKKGNQKMNTFNLRKSVEEFPQKVSKWCQTPFIYPCEEIVLSDVGELGKTAYDLLNIGEELTDNLIVAMFIEYLKTLEDYDGWVLINYPTTFHQAIVLEEALTGVNVPEVSKTLVLESLPSIGDIADLIYRESQWEKEDEDIELRNSKLLPNPEPLITYCEYNTYLTAYIGLKLKDDETLEIPENPTNPLEEFYSDQGCNYAFFHKTYDLATIKHLAKLIIGEYTIPPKTSLELFGETVLYIETDLNQLKKMPGKSSASNKAEEKSDGKITVVTSKEGEDEQLFTKSPKPEPLKPIAGEALWIYRDLPFPEFFQCSLALLWQNIEKIYINDMKELFFIKRVLMNAIVPYVTHVKNHMIDYLTRADDKQNYLYEFQTIYNNVDDDMRDDEEVKAEIQCRITEFREKMYEICDNRMQESESERQRIIHENWLPFQICELTNNYINGMQLEIDRCCDSLQFINDYYHGVITKMPSSELPLKKTALIKIIMYDSKISIITAASNLSETIVDILIQPNETSDNTYFHQFIETTLMTAQTIVDRWKLMMLNFISKMDGNLKPGKKATPRKPVKSIKGDTKSIKGDAKSIKGVVKSIKGVKSGGTQLPPFLIPDPDVLAIATQLIEEWTCSIRGEHLRVKIRLNMLGEKALRDLNDMINCCKKTFHKIYDDIYERYKRELESVDMACEVLAQATEAEVKLQPQLIFDGDKFYIEPDTIVFPDPPQEPEPPLCEPQIEGVFEIKQLEVFVDMLMKIAPFGSIPERAFVFLLQDMIIQNAEDGKKPMVPLLWQRLLPSDVSKLSRKLFGDTEFIDWKDFIIYNLCIRFPTQEELIFVRKQFQQSDPESTEIVNGDQFYDTMFWFSSDFDEINPQEELRLQLIKEIIFKMFKVKEDGFNYTAFLLGFCKDVDPMEGFAKGLCLLLGKEVCWNATIGSVYMNSILEQRFIDQCAKQELQKKHDEVVKHSDSFVDKLIDTTVHLCTSVVIEDYVIEESTIQSFVESENVGSEEYKSILSKDTQTTDGMEFEEASTDSFFTNVEIGFQPHYNKEHVYLLSFDLILTLLTASSPWHAKAQREYDQSVRQKFEVIFDKLKRKDFNNHVFAFELLNHEEFKDLLNNFKFVEKFPPKIVTEMIHQKCI